jgi:Fur family transcriptional regulator, peroxide stress response regulator
MKTESMLDKLKDAGLRITPQRRAICQLLSETEDHPTAAMIYDQLKPKMPSLSLMTVYNTLNALVSVGALYVLGGVGDDNVHYDADTDPHINLACMACHKIIDLPSEHIRRLNQEVNRSSGYQVLGARVLYYGLCPDCQRAAEVA